MFELYQQNQDEKDKASEQFCLDDFFSKGVEWLDNKVFQTNLLEGVTYIQVKIKMVDNLHRSVSVL